MGGKVGRGVGVAVGVGVLVGVVTAWPLVTACWWV